MAQNDPGAIQRGAVVSARGETWTVVERTPFVDCASVTLRAGDGTADARRTRTLLTPFDRVVAAARRGARVRSLRPRRLLHELRRLLASSRPWGSLRSAAGSGIDVLPYQLEPALALASGATRVLIADAVGLGKTIQAGLALAELAAGGEAFRALIACPAGLRAQWQDELALRFHLETTFADTQWLGRRARDLPRDVNPWALPCIYIASFDLLKRPEVLRPLEDVTWDALIVDEAHNAAAGTARRAALHAIGLRSRRVLLLTATPHSGDAADYDALTSLGAHDGDLPVVLFRRTREEVGAGAGRRSVLLGVRLTAAERRMHRLLDDYAARVCREADARHDPRARLAAILLRKRALSSAASLAASASRRLVLLAGALPPDAAQLALPFGDEDPLDDQVTDGVLAAPGLADAGQEQSLLAAIVERATAAAASESKIRVLRRLLSRVGEPVIVFTEYRDTLKRLQEALGSAGLPALALHGGLGAGERLAVQRTFTEGHRLLLATDAASEGLNLQARCRVVVHFELPWAPGRLEQRTGRVDRIGQRRRVHEILLVARDTAERLVLAPLVARAGHVRAARHGSAILDLLGAARVTGPILDHKVSSPAGDWTASRPPAESPWRALGDAEAARIEAIRQRTRTRQSVPPPAVHDARPWIVYCHLPSRPRRREVTAVYASELVSHAGSVEHAAMQALTFSCPIDLPAGRFLLDPATQWTLEIDPALRRALAIHVREIHADVIARHAAAIGARVRREEAMAAALPSAAHALVQASLFDRRALVSAAARTRAAGSRLEASSVHRAGLLAAAQLSPRFRLLAVIVR